MGPDFSFFLGGQNHNFRKDRGLKVNFNVKNNKYKFYPIFLSNPVKEKHNKKLSTKTLQPRQNSPFHESHVPPSTFLQFSYHSPSSILICNFYLTSPNILQSFIQQLTH